MPLTGVAPPTMAAGSQYAGLSADDILQRMYAGGFTQEGINRVYELRNLGPAPTLPASLIGGHVGQGRAAAFMYDAGGKKLQDPLARAFLNTVGHQAVDPYKTYDVGNWLGTAGLIAGFAGAGSAIAGGQAGAGVGAAEGGGSGAAAGGGAGAATGAAEGALPEIVVTGTTGGSLGGAAAGAGAGAAGAGYSGSSNQGWQNTSNPTGSFGASQTGGNAGQLAQQGGISGGAGAGTAGTSGFGAGNMAWTDWIGPAISAASSLIGGKKANGAVLQGQREATAEARRQFDLVRGDTAGQRALGDSAISRISALNGYNTGPGGTAGAPDMSQFTESPDYQFNLAEDSKAIDRSAAARGGLLSGSAVKEGARYASGLASREYGSYVDRLFQQAGIGSTGIGASAAAGANTANNVGAYAMNAGNSRASTYGQTAANVNNSIQGGIQSSLLRRYLGS